MISAMQIESTEVIKTGILGALLKKAFLVLTEKVARTSVKIDSRN